MDVLALIFWLFTIFLIYVFFRFLIPKLLYSTKLAEVAFVSKKIMNSGKKIYSLSCGGKVSGFGISKGFLKLAIYPGGIWIKPVFISPFGIEKDKIINVSINKKNNSNTLRIQHSSKTVGSPLEINLGYGDYSEILQYIGKPLKE